MEQVQYVAEALQNQTKIVLYFKAGPNCGDYLKDEE
jgi:hypothetical protein